MSISLRRLSLVGLLAISSADAGIISTNVPTLTLELRDGSRVVGKDRTEHFKFRSEALGEIKLASQQIVSIDFLAKTNSVKLATTNCDTISAAIVTKDIDLETSFGKISIPVSSLHRISIFGPSAGRPRAGLVAFWSADGNGNSAVGNYSAMAMGPLGYAGGKKGQAFSFAGNRGFLLVHSDENLDVGKGEGFTFEAWINPSTVNSEMLLFEFERNLGSPSGSDAGMEMAIHELTIDGSGVGCLYSNIKDVGDVSHMFTTPPNLLKPGIWQHVALTYDKSLGVGIIYLNGDPVARANLGSFTPQTSFPNLLIGARTTFHSPESPSSVYMGKLEEFGIYNRALSDAEIRAICLEEKGGGASE